VFLTLYVRRTSGVSDVGSLNGVPSGYSVDCMSQPAADVCYRVRGCPLSVAGDGQVFKPYHVMCARRSLGGKAGLLCTVHHAFFGYRFRATGRAPGALEFEDISSGYVVIRAFRGLSGRGYEYYNSMMFALTDVIMEGTNTPATRCAVGVVGQRLVHVVLAFYFDCCRVACDRTFLSGYGIRE